MAQASRANEGAKRDIVAIGTSAGGVQALQFLAAAFPPDFPAVVLVVIHLSAQFNSELDSILSVAGPLKASFARDGEKAQNGRIYLAPAERHLLLDGDILRLGSGPRENSARPAIDPLFRSVALCCCNRAVGVIMTGTLGDGSSGLHALQQCGAIIVVQDPADAAHAEMPQAALDRVEADHVVSLSAMPALLGDLVAEPAGEAAPVPDSIRYEVEIAKSGRSTMRTMDRIGRRSVLACPDCHGVMWEIEENGLLRYRCHVGHAYTAELMSLALDENLSRALGSGLRALEERSALADRLRKQAMSQGRHQLADSWARRMEESEQEADTIREAIKRAEHIAAHAPLTEAAE
jgi:two-component system chemotaxis response regulator CheB